MPLDSPSSASVDCDVALIGNGLAPLIAATHLLAQGKTVLLLNPDWDFFLEDSELPLDPLIPTVETTPSISSGPLGVSRIRKSLPENTLEQLRPQFPGAVEFWQADRGVMTTEVADYHDASAPHVRQRNRLWIAPTDSGRHRGWDQLENLYVEASDHELHPQIIEGIQATKRFPGNAQTQHEGFYRGLWVPQLCDVDVSRYRRGVLEFVRERLGPRRMISRVGQIELIPEGVRFHHANGARTSRVSEGVLVFWTPRLTSWIHAQGKRFETRLPQPLGLRPWEEWSLVSREALNPGVVGVFENLCVWADFEGTPRQEDLYRLTVLRSGALSPVGFHFASSDSFASLTRLCHDFLRWERFSIRSLKTRVLFEWEMKPPAPVLLSHQSVPCHIITGCDGPLTSVVENARQSCVEIFG